MNWQKRSLFTTNIVKKWVRKKKTKQNSNMGGLIEEKRSAFERHEQPIRKRQLQEGVPVNSSKIKSGYEEKFESNYKSESGKATGKDRL